MKKRIPISKLNTCEVCLSKCTHRFPKCKKCNICHQCQAKWLQKQINDQKWTTQKTREFKLSCGGCSRNLIMHEIIQLQNLYSPILITISEIIIKNNKYRFIPCSSKSCKNIGWIDDLDCQEFTCNLCQFSWKNPEKNKPIIELIYEEHLFEEIKSRIFKFLFSKRFPSCKVPIQREGGCNRVKCTNCYEEFCWACKITQYHHSNFLCGIISLFQVMLIFSPINYFAYQFGIFQSIYEQLLEFFTIEYFFYGFGFLSIIPFLFRFIFKHIIIALILMIIYTKQDNTLFVGLLIIDIILWALFCRWNEVLYYLFFTPQVFAYIQKQ